MDEKFRAKRNAYNGAESTDNIYIYIYAVAQWQLAAPPRGGCVVTPTEAGTNKHRVRFGAGGRDGRRPAAETTNRKFVGSRAIIPPHPSPLSKIRS